MESVKIEKSLKYSDFVLNGYSWLWQILSHHFRCKNLFGACGQIVNGAIAYLAPDGGGPVTPHTHATDHLFIVTQGEAKVLLDGQERIIRENEAFIVKGGIPHSVWNNAQAETVMIGITLKNNENGK